MKQITFQVPEEDWQVITEAAKEEERSKSAFIRFHVLEIIKNKRGEIGAAINQ